MKTLQTSDRRKAFTLIELLVVVSIIALLISILIPATSMIRNRARATQTAALFSGLQSGLESFRAEQYLGGTYPPSATDQAEIEDRSEMANPLATEEGDRVTIAGAHLLLGALLGADLLGTPGFRDLDRDGFWWNDQSKALGKAYELGEIGAENELDPLVARYGGAGYVSEDTKSRHVSSLFELVANGALQDDRSLDDIEADAMFVQPMFVDPWERPILYYKANPSGRRIIATATNPNGVFWQEDNAVITGSVDGARGEVTGVKFVYTNPTLVAHEIENAAAPPPAPDIDSDSGQDRLERIDTTYDHSLARFIFNPAIKARREPYNKDSYLLISAGLDGRYGTRDDIVNWKRR